MRQLLSRVILGVFGERRGGLGTIESESRFAQYSVIYCAALVAMLTFGLHNLLESRYLVVFLLFCSLTGLSMGWYLLYHGKAETFVYRLNSMLFLVLLVYFMIAGGKDNAMILWVNIGPLILFILLGRREGAVWTSMMWLCIVVNFYAPPEWLDRHVYSFAFSIRFTVAFTIISVITFFYENFRYLYKRDLEEKNSTLVKEVEDRIQAETALRESEERYRAVYLQAAEGILLVNFQGDIVECNPQIQRILGFAEHELVERNIFTLMHPDDLEKTPPQLEKLKAGEVIFLERHLRSRSGIYVLFEQSGKRIGDDLIILLYRDITERKIADIALERANQALDRLAHIDGLTQIANRRRFDQTLEREWKRMVREEKELGIILTDIDYFKQYNDIYGHQAGDDCLKNVAATLSGLVHRPADLVSRYGGEEFVVLLPDTDEEGCRNIAEKLRKSIEQLKIPHSGSKVQPVVTMSFGVSAGTQKEFSSSLELVNGADRSLYRAKENGRNQVVSLIGNAS